MSTNETPKSIDFASVPLQNLLLPPDRSKEKLIALHPYTDEKQVGIVLDEDDFYQLYYSDDSNTLTLNYWFEDILNGVDQDLALKYFDSRTDEERNIGITVAGSTIDIITILDDEKITYKEKVRTVINCVEWVNTNLDGVIDTHYILGHCFGRSLALANFGIDNQMNAKEAVRFISNYGSIAGPDAKGSFILGYEVGIQQILDEHDIFQRPSSFSLPTKS